MGAIKIDQAGLPAGTPGQSRTDGLDDGSVVTLENVGPSGFTQFRLRWVPPEDDSAVVSLAPIVGNPDVWSFTPAAACYGTYLVELLEDGVSIETRVFGVRTPLRRLLIPALNEKASKLASLVNDGPDQVALSENNATDFGNAALDAVPYAGWWRAMAELYRVVETRSLPDGTIQNAPLAWQGSAWAESLFLRLALARGPDGGGIEMRASDAGGNATASVSAGGDPGTLLLLAAAWAFMQGGNGRYEQQAGDEFTPVHRFQTLAFGAVENLAMSAVPGPAPTIGFLGAAPVARPALDGATTQAHVDALVSALAQLGLVTDSRTGPGGIGPTELHTIRLIASYRE